MNYRVKHEISFYYVFSAMFLFYTLRFNRTVIESSTKTMCRSLSNLWHSQILTFNVEGLKTKLDDSSILELIQKYDTIILIET